MIDLKTVKILNISQKELITHLNQSPSIKLIQQKFKISDHKKIYKLSSILTVLLAACLDDGQINQLEYKYLLREIKDWYKFQDKVSSAIIDMHIQLVKSHKKYAKFFVYHYNYIVQYLTEEEKIRLFDNIVILLRSDLELSASERDYAQEFGQIIGLPAHTAKESLMTAGVIIEQKLAKIREEEALSYQQAQENYTPTEIEIDL